MLRVSTESISPVDSARCTTISTLVVHLLNYTLIDKSGNYQLPALLRLLFARIINWSEFVRESIRAAGYLNINNVTWHPLLENGDASVKSRIEYGLLPYPSSSFWTSSQLLDSSLTGNRTTRGLDLGLGVRSKGRLEKFEKKKNFPRVLFWEIAEFLFISC